MENWTSCKMNFQPSLSLFLSPSLLFSIFLSFSSTFRVKLKGHSRCCQVLDKLIRYSADQIISKLWIVLTYFEVLRNNGKVTIVQNDKINLSKSLSKPFDAFNLERPKLSLQGQRRHWLRTENEFWHLSCVQSNNYSDADVINNLA